MTVHMALPHLHDLPPVQLADPYRLATAAEFPDPAPVWAHLVSTCFDDKEWTPEHVRENFISKEQHDPRGVFFAMHAETAVATAFGWLDEPGERTKGRVHYVGVLPQHRRKGLARALVLCVLHYFRERDFEGAILGTGPELFPAIRLYLSLGFEPAPYDAEEEKVWEGIGRQVGS